MICLLTAVGLTPSGSSTVHIYIQTIRRTIQSTQAIHRTTIDTNNNITIQSTQTIHRTTIDTNNNITTQSTQTIIEQHNRHKQ